MLLGQFGLGDGSGWDVGVPGGADFGQVVVARAQVAGVNFSRGTCEKYATVYLC